MHKFNFPVLTFSTKGNVKVSSRDLKVSLVRVSGGKVVSVAQEYEGMKDLLSTAVGDSYLFKHGDKKVLLVNVGLAEKERKAEELIAKAIAAVPDNIKTIGLDLGGDAQVDWSILTSELLVQLKTNWSVKKSDDSKGVVIKHIYLGDFSCADKIHQIESGLALGKVKSWVQQMVSMPANYLTPKKFANEIALFLKENDLEGKIKFEAHGEAWALKENMGSFYGVAKGSREELQFIEMSYLGAQSGEEAPIVLVGKGVMFDTGGISLKPSKGMGDMKGDMAGAASAVASIMYAALMGLPLNVVSLAPCCENMPDGNAVKPGDVLIAKNGKSIEVVNTDAEGRLVLADALVYAQKFNGRYTIDMATLTGACITAIGYEYSGLFTEDEELGYALLSSGDEAKDWAWHLPMDSDLHKGMLKSKVADMSNSSEGAQGAGATNGAIFLKEFAPEKGWAHLDIAGVSEVRGSGNPTARPVGLIAKFLEGVASGTI